MRSVVMVAAVVAVVWALATNPALVVVPLVFGLPVVWHLRRRGWIR